MKKEFRVYTINADDLGDLNISAHDIKDWDLYQDYYNKLTQQAEEFINICEQKGSVYSLDGFMIAFNLDQTISQNDYIFITNNY